MLVPKNDKIWAFLTELKYVSLTLPSYITSFSVWFPYFEDMFRNTGGFGYGIVLKIRSNKLNMAVM